MAIFAGCDVGSTTGKVVLIDENKSILGFSIVRSAKGPEATAARAFEEAFAAAHLSAETKIEHCIATGYGRTGVRAIKEDVSEITCHAKGAYHMCSTLRTIVDIGGQDCKVISLNAQGKVVDFQMNDKCSAGTGRFFEVMARVLDCSLSELAEYGLKSDKPCPISKQCSVFAESEVISLINNNVKIEDISAGIHESIARRIQGMILKVGLEEDITLTGGCAQNKALARALEARLNVKFVTLSAHPQIMGALGAALFAWERVASK